MKIIKCDLIATSVYSNSITLHAFRTIWSSYDLIVTLHPCRPTICDTWLTIMSRFLSSIDDDVFKDVYSNDTLPSCHSIDWFSHVLTNTFDKSKMPFDIDSVLINMSLRGHIMCIMHTCTHLLISPCQSHNNTTNGWYNSLYMYVM